MTKSETALKRMISQRLAGNGLGSPEMVTAWMGAVQAQDYAMAKWGLGLRGKGMTDKAIDEAVARGEILRTHGPRPTWHFISPADIRWMLELLTPRVIAGIAGRYRELELDEDTFRRSQEAFARALMGGQQLTREELRARLEAEGISTAGQRMPHLLMRAEMDRLLVSGARKGKNHSYMLLEERVPPATPLKREEALAELVRRFFTSRGPARIQDFTWWSGLTTSDALGGIALNHPNIANEKIDGQPYFYALDFVPDPASTAIPRAVLLPVYDELMVSYTRRAAMLARVEGKLPGPGESGTMQNLVLVDGQVVGGWKRTQRKQVMEVTVSAFVEISADERGVIGEAAQRFADFYGLPVDCRFE